MPGLYDYRAGAEIAAARPPFYALIQAAVRGADSENLARLERAFPEEVAEMIARDAAPNGVLPATEAQP